MVLVVNLEHAKEHVILAMGKVKFAKPEAWVLLLL
jgi:hypothetical protein